MNDSNGSNMESHTAREDEELVKSKQRVADHGEVFTPAWMVEDMLDLVKSESQRIDSRFLEPACGSGNFLKAVLARKLRTVESRYKKSDFELRHYALLAIMSIYGIELLADNVEECRQNLLGIFAEFLPGSDSSVWDDAARKVLCTNIIQGDALTLKTATGNPIEFPEWGYLGKGKFQRRDFRYEALTKRSDFGRSLDSPLPSLFQDSNSESPFVPTRSYSVMTVKEIAE